MGLLLIVSMAVFPLVASAKILPAAPALVTQLESPFAPKTASAGPSFATPVGLPNSNGFGEPSIATAPDGTLYVVAPGTGTWRSDDQGTTWSRQADTLGNSGDSDIAIDADGVVYGSDLFNSAPVSVSMNRAASYAYSTATNNGGSLDREWVAVSGHGNVFATVRDGGNEEFSVSHDQGHTFSAPITVATNAGLRGNIYAASDVDLYIPYSNGVVKLAVSHNGGSTWTSHNVASVGGTECIFPGVARDALGTLYVTWCEFGSLGFPSSGNARIYLAASKDDGATWSTPLVLSDDANFNVFPWIVAGNAGRVFVTWYEGVPILPDVLHVRDPVLAFLVNWHVEVSWSLNADQAAPLFQRVAATGVTHTGPICTSGTGCLPGTRGLLDFFEMTEMLGGNVAIAYAGGDTLSLPTLGQNLGTVSQLFAVIQNGGSNLRT